MPPSSTSTASASAGTQTDDTTTPVNIESQTRPMRPATTSASTQTNYGQATTTIQTQPHDNEHLQLLKSDQAAKETVHREGYEKGKKEGFKAGIQYGMTAERIVWNGYHGPDLCIQTQVQKMDGATQMEPHLPMDSRALRYSPLMMNVLILI
jgi:flagellar biosynthesis/type III secretory pathway protein FliH